MGNAPARWPTSWVYFDGQSLNNIPENPGYPAFLMQGRGLPWKNVSVSGASWTTLLTTDQTRLHPYLAYGTAEKRILILCGGTTDVNDGDTGAQIHADMVAYADAARAAGATHVIATTITPSDSFSAGENTQRDAANALIVADTANDFDGVADLDGTAGLDDHTNNTYYFDGTHWWWAGAELAASVVGPVLDAVLAL